MFIPTFSELVENNVATGRFKGYNARAPLKTSYTFEADPFEYAADAVRDPNWTAAAENLKQAIDTGVVFPEAHYLLGYLYSGGLGIAQNNTVAVELYKVASDAGYPQASHNLGLLLVHGKGVSLCHRSNAWVTGADQSAGAESRYFAAVFSWRETWIEKV